MIQDFREVLQKSSKKMGKKQKMVMKGDCVLYVEVNNMVELTSN